MSYGVTATGFVRPSYNDILTDLIADAETIFGPINTGPESAIYQRIVSEAERESLLWDAMEVVYLGMYPDSAAGRSLDGAVQFTGITRLAATHTLATIECTGTAATVIPAASQISNTNGDLFSVVADITLDGSGTGIGQARAITAGPILALAGTLTTIETPVDGWSAVTNANNGTPGRAVESDSELRIRRAQSLQVGGAGTVEAIRSRLLEQVADVSAATIIENRSDAVDIDGRPAHSFEAVVSGGIDQDIADMLWLVKSAGIETHGGVTVNVTDSQGTVQAVSFSRPINAYIWAKVTVTVGTPAEFPDDASDTIKAKIVEYGSATFGVGDDVIYQALFGPIYQNVPGISSVTITLASSAAPTPEPGGGSFAAANIDIPSAAISQWLADRIAVTINV